MTDFFAKYFAYVDGGEAPLLCHRWTAIAGIGAILARQAYVMHGHSTIFPNHYVLLLGESGSRKTAAITMMRRVMEAAGFTQFACERTTPSQFFADLEGAPHAFETKKGAITEPISLESLLREDKPADDVERNVCIAADELHVFMANNVGDFAVALTSVWDNLPKFDYRPKTSAPVHVHKPTVTLLAGNTPADFSAYFPPAIIGQGFLARTIVVQSVRPEKRITWPKECDYDLQAELVAHIQKIRDTIKGKLTFTQAAMAALDEIYTTFEDLSDARLRAYSSRRFQHLLKLLIVVTAMRLSMQVDVQDVLLANTLLVYTESFMASALGEFGNNTTSAVTHTVLQTIMTSTEPVTQQYLWQRVMRDLKGPHELANILHNLYLGGKIGTLVDPDTNLSLYTAKVSQRKINHKWVNYNLLIETAYGKNLEGIPRP